ncbi:unnamed protein product [Rhizophagus irregularis]|nr:unnamed protein product [Rhizophagus irregularis]
MQDTENTNNTNEWINWIEEAVDKEHLKFYEYEEFNNIQHIGTGGFGNVYRANWKNSGKLVALKSFISLNNFTMKEIVRELKIQRKVDFHDNIISCYGVTKLELENHNNYRLVLEYADGVHRDLHSCVLFWEISSGQPPFYVEDEEYDVGLAVEISQGLRETVVPDTPEEYIKIYTECWDGEPDNRPTIYQY